MSTLSDYMQQCVHEYICRFSSEINLLSNQTIKKNPKNVSCYVRSDSKSCSDNTLIWKKTFLQIVPFVYNYIYRIRR